MNTEGKPSTNYLAKKKLPKTTPLDSIPIIREIPVLGRAAYITARYIGAWLRAEDGQVLARLLVLCSVGFAAFFVAGRRPYLWWVYGGLLYLICAVVAAKTGLGAGRTVAAIEEDAQAAEYVGESGEEEREGEEPGEAGEEPDQPLTEVDRRAAEAEFLEYVEHAVTLAVHHGRKGLHTDVLLAGLHSEDILTEWTEPMIRQKCADLGVTVRTQMGILGRNYFGVHVDDLTADLGRRPRRPPQLVEDRTIGAPAPAPVKAPTPGPALALVPPPS
ncbi:hypothetical protein [Streptomyces sp. NPDC056549]|uniref:hypothetical protein n=1 Tax=Streptomyces sp. NPDC056549 TaxID=3345864 RepID=UPI0036B0A19A